MKNKVFLISLIGIVQVQAFGLQLKSMPDTTLLCKTWIVSESKFPEEITFAKYEGRPSVNDTSKTFRLYEFKTDGTVIVTQYWQNGYLKKATGGSIRTTVKVEKWTLKRKELTWERMAGNLSTDEQLGDEWKDKVSRIQWKDIYYYRIEILDTEKMKLRMINTKREEIKK